MRAFACALFAIVAVAASSEASAQPWKTSKWKDLGFSAEFPATPSLDSSSVMDSMPRMMMIVGATTKAGYFAVMSTPMPEFTVEAIADSAMREQILDGAQRQSLEDAGATLQSQRSITLAGRYGREIFATVASENLEMRTRIYLEPERMYMQIAVFELGKSAVTATRFLKSFRFL